MSCIEVGAVVVSGVDVAPVAYGGDDGAGFVSYRYRANLATGGSYKSVTGPASKVVPVEFFEAVSAEDDRVVAPVKRGRAWVVPGSSVLGQFKTKRLAVERQRFDIALSAFHAECAGKHGAESAAL